MAIFRNYEGEWEVIDDHNGEVLDSFDTREEAEAGAAACGQNAKEVSWNWVRATRSLEEGRRREQEVDDYYRNQGF